VSAYHPIRLTRFDFDAADFLSSPDVASMTATEVGQYVLLLAAAWLGGKNCCLPNDPRVLAKLARAPRGVSPRVRGKFKSCPGKTQLIYNPRLSREWDAAQQRAQVRQQKAQKAAQKRWNEMPGACPKQSSGTEQAMLGDASESESVSESVSGVSQSPQDQEVFSVTSNR